MNNIASTGRRLTAFLIDRLLGIFLILLLVFWLSGAVNLGEILDRFLIFLIFCFVLRPLVSPLINCFLTATFGGSLGKIIAGIKIVDNDGRKISFWRAFFRNVVGYMVSGVFLWLGFIWIIIDKQRRGWHDQIADTYVVVFKKWRLWLGILVVFVLLGFNFYLGIRALGNFSQNRLLYQNIVREIVKEAEGF